MSDVHGGAVGLYENHEALTLFMFAGPDCTRCIKEFETLLNPTTSNTAHHEKASALQTTFRTNVLAFVEVVEQLGNHSTMAKTLWQYTHRKSWKKRLLHLLLSYQTWVKTCMPSLYHTLMSKYLRL